MDYRIGLRVNENMEYFDWYYLYMGIMLDFYDVIELGC